MTDVAILPHQMDRSTSLLDETSRAIGRSATRLRQAEGATAVNDADPAFSVGGFKGRSRGATSGLQQASRDLRALSDHVQLTRSRIVAADDGGAAATAYPTPGHLLRPGVGFGSLDSGDDGLQWLDLITVASVVDETPKVAPTAKALVSHRGRFGPTHAAVREVAHNSPSLTTMLAQRSRRPAAAAGSAMQRAAYASLWADEATLVGARVSTTLSQAGVLTANPRVVSAGKIAGRVGNIGLTTVGVALDTKSAVESFADGDIEQGSIHTARAGGGAVSILPGGQVVGLSIVGATYVVEYREEIWGGFMSAVDFVDDAITGVTEDDQ